LKLTYGAFVDVTCGFVSPLDATIVHTVVTISYHILGDDAPISTTTTTTTSWITFLHGFPTCSYDFVPLLPSLLQANHSSSSSVSYRLLLWDYYGYGDSDKTPGLPPCLSCHLLADLQVALWSHLGITTTTHLITHDLGDTVAQELLARWQEGSVTSPQLDKILLFNGGLFPALHRPILTQRLLLNPYIGPLISRLSNKTLFSSSFSSVFGKDTQPTQHDLEQHWKVRKLSVLSIKRSRMHHSFILYL